MIEINKSNNENIKLSKNNQKQKRNPKFDIKDIILDLDLGNSYISQEDKNDYNKQIIDINTINDIIKKKS